jgi:formylglycine-generating enzyme required for sulfatase activity
MSVIEGPVTVATGAFATQSGASAADDPRFRMIDRRFAIADREVTLEQFHRFQVASNTRGSPRELLDISIANRALGAIDWYGAVEYCNWLSDQEQLPRCYSIRTIPGTNEEAVVVEANALKSGGYRLPTVAEWVYACRAGAETSRYYGSTEALLSEYAWFSLNSGEAKHVVGELFPNDLGLFDMLGNVGEWCQDKSLGEIKDRDELSGSVIVRGTDGVSGRGGGFTNRFGVRSTGRLDYPASGSSYVTAGFRVARTLPRSGKLGAQP